MEIRGIGRGEGAEKGDGDFGRIRDADSKYRQYAWSSSTSS
jgi:hypothetical protein